MRRAACAIGASVPRRAACAIGAIPRRSQPVVMLTPRPPSCPPTREQRDKQAVEEHMRRAACAIGASVPRRAACEIGAIPRASPYSVPRSLDEILADHGVCEVQPRHGRRRGRSRSQRRRRPTQNRGPISLPARLLRGAAASRREVGSSWHFGGLRTWLWRHDGIQVNGWIQLGARGVLHHGFSCTTRHGEARWQSGDHPGQLILSFGHCHHYCELIYGSMTCDTPMFDVIDREMREDGRLCESQSMGELVMEDEESETHGLL